MSTYEFIFNIKAESKGRPRFGNGKTYTPEKTRAFENAIAWEARKQLAGKPILKGLLSANIVFEFEKPKKTKLLTPRSDLDNLQKSVFDSINEIVYDDDTQIVLITAFKRWSTQNRIRLLIGEWKEQEA